MKTIKHKGGDKMVLELYSGETKLRTLYNVIKVTENYHHQLTVVNKVEGVLVTNTFLFNKQYNNLITMVD